jgi:protein-L-isoaspartate(D-aspartate) O-methyltransferase
MSDADLQAAKHQMIRRQLHGRGIRDNRVLEAMNDIPREKFISPEWREDAYADRALGIDCGQTISQPYMVALMTEALELSGTEKVLEIGTGSGYQTAILAELAADVISVERHNLLSQQAAKTLEEMGYKKVRLVVGDGTLGWPAEAPYDRIIVTAMAAECPNALLQQLAEDGIIVIPIGNRDTQILQAIRKVQGELRVTNLSGCRFVPLIGAQGWPDA